MPDSPIVDDNAEKQKDEIAAISAIYGEEFEEEDASEGKYVIHFNRDTVGYSHDVDLKVTLPKSYPTTCPPVYEIHASWMERSFKQDIHDALQNIYLDNIGESILYIWAEKVREFLTSLDTLTPDSPIVESPKDNQIYHVKDEAIDLNVPCHEIFHGEPLIDRKSVFQAHVAKVTSTCQVQTVQNALLQNKKVANATHNILAYRYHNDKGGVVQDCDDDGETAAGSRLLHLLNILNVDNTIVIVSRWYGGIHLGPDRFKHINNVARRALSDHGFLKAV